MEKNTILTREEWLYKGLKKLENYVFKNHGYSFENIAIKVSCGFCKGENSIGICCPKEYSEGGFTEIFIDPKIDNSLRVLDILAHEMIHALALGGKSHGKEFKAVAEKIGLMPPMKSTTANAKLKEILNIIINEIGEYPHKKYHIIKTIKTISDIEKSKQFICKNRCYEMSVKKKFYEIEEPICPVCTNKMRIKIIKENGNQFDIIDIIEIKGEK